MNIPNNWNNSNAANEKTGALVSLTGTPAEITTGSNVRTFTWTPNAASGTAARAYLGIIVANHINEGETITITALDSTISLTASTAPSSGEFWTTATAPTNLAAYTEQVAESIADSLQNIAFITTNFDIYSTASQAALTAKQTGSKFDITGAASQAGTIWFSTGAGADEYLTQEKRDYFTFADVYVGTELFAQSVDKFAAELVDSYLLDTETMETNAFASSVKHRISPILPEKQLSGTIIPQQLDSANLAILRPYFVVYGDSYRYKANGQRKKYTKGVSAVRWVQVGANDALRPYDMSQYIFDPTQNTPFNWLTTRPSGRAITMQSHSFIQCIVKQPSTPHTARIEVIYTFYDNTTFIDTYKAFDVSMLGGNVSFDVSPNTLDIEAVELQQGKLVQSYAVRLAWDFNGSTVYSSEHVLTLDRACYDNQEQVVFLNELGAWDSITFKGEKRTTVQRNQTTTQRAVPFNANKTPAIRSEVRVMRNISSANNLTLNSGILGDLHYIWSKALLNSSAVYLWNAKLNDYEAIIITGHEYTHKTSEEGHNLRITAQRTVSNNTVKR
jgi:hypothetical protein